MCVANGPSPSIVLFLVFVFFFFSFFFNVNLLEIIDNPPLFVCFQCLVCSIFASLAQWPTKYCCKLTILAPILFDSLFSSFCILLVSRPFFFQEYLSSGLGDREACAARGREVGTPSHSEERCQQSPGAGASRQGLGFFARGAGESASRWIVLRCCCVGSACLHSTYFQNSPSALRMKGVGMGTHSQSFFADAAASPIFFAAKGSVPNLLNRLNSIALMTRIVVLLFGCWDRRRRCSSTAATRQLRQNWKAFSGMKPSRGSRS